MGVKHISTTETAVRWNISARRVAILCESGRVEGAEKTGNTWIIPENAEKPADARIKSGKYIKSNKEAVSDGSSN